MATTTRKRKTTKRRTTAKRTTKKPAKKKHKLDAKAMKRIINAAAKRGIVKKTTAKK